MKPTQDARKRYLTSVLENFATEGFSYRSVNDGEEEQHGLSIDDAVHEAFAVEMATVTVTHVPSRTRKIGMLIVLDGPDQAPMDLIVDYGSANQDDMEIAERCIERGTSA